MEVYGIDNDMAKTSYLDAAVEILDNAKGKPQSLEERKRLTIELASLMVRESTC